MITFIDFFAGIGGARRGMELAGHKCVGFCEWDKFARASYISMHCMTDEERVDLSKLDINKRQKEIWGNESKYVHGEWYSNDIRSVDAGNIPRADCWCFGAPCLLAGTLITTDQGMKPIEEIQAGDMVLTHKNRFKKVVIPMVNTKKGIYTLKVQGSPNTEVTGNHRFYVRYVSKKFNSKTRLYDLVWSEPEWKAVEDFNGEEYIEFPQNRNAENIFNLSEDEAWLLGRYVADGYIQDYPRKDRPSNTQRVAWCIGDKKREEFEKHILQIKSHTEKYKSCYKYITNNKRLFDLCHQCGRGAVNKTIPQFIMDLPKELLEVFLDGYLSGDGYLQNDIYTASSVSRTLIYQLGQVINKVYEVPYTITFHETKPVRMIENRKVNQNNYWTIRFSKKTKSQNHGKTVDGVLWMPIRKITFDPDRTETVYNMEVEDDNSYTANNMGLHNCQSFSIAGKRAGLDGESGLIREVFRILGEIEEKSRPEWLIYENVKGMFSSNKGFDYLAILLAMDELGYDIEWQVFNSKDWGVPQNRERVYTVGHLRTHGSRKIFPLGSTNGENSVQVSLIGHRDGYRKNLQTYSTDGITETMDTGGGGGREHHVAIPMFGIDYNVGGEDRPLANTIKARYDAGVTNFKQDGTAVCIPIIAGYKDGISEADVSPTLMARDYKGINNQPMGAAAIPIVVPVLTPDRAEKRQNGRRFKDNGDPAFTLTAIDKHGVGIEVKPVKMSGYECSETGDVANCLNVNDQRKIFGAKQDRTMVAVEIRNGLQEHQTWQKDISPTLTAAMGMGGGYTPIITVPIVKINEEQKDFEHPGVYVQLAEDCIVYAVWYEKYQCYIAIRKLLPLECFRLQGWEDEYFYRAELVNSDSQLYKQAGNGITVTVMEAIAKAIG